MPASSARNKLATVLAAALLLTGLLALSAGAAHGADRPHTASAALLHHGAIAPSPLRSLAADLQQHPGDLGLLAAMLLAATFGVSIRFPGGADRPDLRLVAVRSGRGPPS
ncbi:MAG: hypothetical protein ACR2N4_00070 [Jatrophihabitans sp.]